MKAINNNNPEINSEKLKQRINQNIINQKLNFNKWIFSKIQKSNNYKNILELCCGTGNQTKYLSMIFNKANIFCVDLSKESIDYIKKEKYYSSGRIKLVCEDIDNFFLYNKKKFDFIFCCYGLYYSKNVKNLLNEIYKYLNYQGKFVLIGPYGNNNKQIFELLQKSKIPIKKHILSSSSSFMYDVLKHSTDLYQKIIIYTVKNEIKWFNIDDLLTYWKNSTFFYPSREFSVKNELINHYKKNKFFKNDKFIMLIIFEKHEK